MSKKKKNPATTPPESPKKVLVSQVEHPDILPPVEQDGLLSKVTSGFIPYVLFVILGLALYANTFNHQFALDDELIVSGNTYVLKGIDGLGEIMGSDIFDSYNKSLNAEANLAGGRFRPFSLATFAIEQEFIGTMPDGIKPDSWDLNKNKVGDPNEDYNGDGVFNEKDTQTKGMAFRHVNNVILYILSICVLYLFLSTYFFKDNKMIALTACLLFLAHPIHTEVVANVKSRDEILSLMFIVLTMHLSFIYVETKKMKPLIWALVCYFIALLSKEYGAAWLIIIPASIYVYFKQMKWSEIRLLLVGLVVTFGIYFAMRSRVTVGLGANVMQDNELLNNPFLYATPIEAMATKIFINLKYFLLMLLPLKLSSDYSFNSIPFRTFASPDVWLSILLLLGLSAGIFLAYRKRHWMLMPLLTILLPLLMINNFFFNIGATMGERLAYHSSFGVCILIVYGLYYLFNKVMPGKQALAFVALLPLLVFYSYKTIARNPAWKNNITLYSTDVKAYPNGAMLNGNACISYFDLSNMPANKSREKQLLDSANQFGLKALTLHPKYFYTHLNLGLVKAKQGDMDSATYHWLKTREMSPYEKKLPEFLESCAAYYYNKGVGFLDKGQLDDALKNLNMAHTIKPNDHRPLYFLGKIYYTKGNYPMAKQMWSKGLSFAPGDQVLQAAVQSVAAY